MAQVAQVLVVGDRLVAIRGLNDSTQPGEIRQSFDSGNSWVALRDLTGAPVSVAVSADGGSLLLLDAQRNPIWRLTPVTRDEAATPPLSIMPATPAPRGS